MTRLESRDRGRIGKLRLHAPTLTCTETAGRVSSGHFVRKVVLLKVTAVYQVQFSAVGHRTKIPTSIAPSCVLVFGTLSRLPLVRAGIVQEVFGRYFHTEIMILSCHMGEQVCGILSCRLDFQCEGVQPSLHVQAGNVMLPAESPAARRDGHCSGCCCVSVSRTPPETPLPPLWAPRVFARPPLPWVACVT